MATRLQDNLVMPNDDVCYYQALISGIDDVIIFMNKNFIVKTWNAAAEKLYEITSEEAIGAGLYDILFHEYIDATPEQVQQILANENFWKGVVKIILRSGKIIFLHSAITAVSDSSCKKIGYISIGRDITEEMLLKQSVKNFESILTVLDESFLIVDEQLKIAFMRPKGDMQRFFNSDHKLGDDALKYIPPKYLNEVKESYQKAFNGETVSYDAVSDTKPKMYVNVSYTPLKDNFNNVKNVCVVIKNFTAQKEIEILQQKKATVENSLFESRKFFKDFMENTPLLSWVADEDGYIHYANAAYLKLFKFNENIVGRNLYEIFPDHIAKQFSDDNKKVIKTGEVFEVIEKRNPWFSKVHKVIKFPIFFKGKTMVAAWAMDISNEIAAQESLMLLNQNKNKIMSVIAHDIRAPLGVNNNIINTIIRDYETFEKEELFQYLNLMQQSLTKCFSLTENLLLWARSQLQTISYNPVALEADIEINKVIENMILIAERKKISIETKYCFTNEIYADADMFAIAVRNFISNAVKFSKRASAIQIATQIRQNKLMISVKDCGIGMTKELSNKILHTSNYESSFGTSGEKGAGLGLIIAKDYIERNKGEMFIESEEGRGSTFSFTVGFAEKYR